MLRLGIKLKELVRDLFVFCFINSVCIRCVEVNFVIGVCFCCWGGVGCWIIGLVGCCFFFIEVVDICVL